MHTSGTRADAVGSVRAGFRTSSPVLRALPLVQSPVFLGQAASNSVVLMVLLIVVTDIWPQLWDTQPRPGQSRGAVLRSSVSLLKMSGGPRRANSSPGWNFSQLIGKSLLETQHLSHPRPAFE